MKKTSVISALLLVAMFSVTAGQGLLGKFIAGITKENAKYCGIAALKCTGGLVNPMTHMYNLLGGFTGPNRLKRFSKGLAGALFLYEVAQILYPALREKFGYDLSLKYEGFPSEKIIATKKAKGFKKNLNQACVKEACLWLNFLDKPQEAIIKKVEKLKNIYTELPGWIRLQGLLWGVVKPSDKQIDEDQYLRDKALLSKYLQSNKIED